MLYVITGTDREALGGKDALARRWGEYFEGLLNEINERGRRQ